MEEVSNRLKGLAPKIYEAVAIAKNKKEIEEWARPFVTEICAIAMPDYLVEFRERSNPQEEKKEADGLED